MAKQALKKYTCIKNKARVKRTSAQLVEFGSFRGGRRALAAGASFVPVSDVEALALCKARTGQRPGAPARPGPARRQRFRYAGGAPSGQGTARLGEGRKGKARQETDTPLAARGPVPRPTPALTSRASWSRRARRARAPAAARRGPGCP